MYRTVVFPAIIPELVGGIRVAIGVSWGIQIVTELMGAQQGMGQVFSMAMPMQALDLIIVGVLWITRTGHNYMRLYLNRDKFENISNLSAAYKIAYPKTAQAKTPRTPRLQASQIPSDAEPQINSDLLSMKAQQKLAAAMRQEKSKLAAQFRAEVNARIDELLVNTIGPQALSRKVLALTTLRSTPRNPRSSLGVPAGLPSPLATVAARAAELTSSAALGLGPA